METTLRSRLEIDLIANILGVESPSVATVKASRLWRDDVDQH